MKDKQTAVDSILAKLNNVKPTEFCSIETIKEWCQQAKEMEKEQMIQFAIKCMFNSDDIGSNLKNNFIKKYNEEFGGNDEQK